AREEEMIDLDAKHGISALIVAMVLAVGCGNSGQVNERVWLDVFNAYPGTSSLSLYGPSSAVATNVNYGNLSPGQPTAVDRNLGTDFKLLLQGAPTSYDLELPLFNLYPDETATLMFKRRSGPKSVDAAMYRQIRTGYSKKAQACRLVLDNALSVQNAENNIAQYNYLPVFKIRPSCAGYNLKIGKSFDDSSDLTVSLQGGGSIDAGRPDLYKKIHEDPWFIPTAANSGEIIRTYNQTPRGGPPCAAVSGSGEKETEAAGQRTVKWVWVGYGAKEAEIDFSSGSFRAPPPSQQYMKCIGWDPDKKKNRQSIKSQQVIKCKGDQHKATAIKLGKEVSQLEFSTGIGLKKKNGKNGKLRPVPKTKCGTAIQVVSDFFNVFNKQKGKQNRIERMITYDPSQYYYWILYGRPIVPHVQHWSVKPPRKAKGNKPRGGGYVKVEPRPTGNSSK
ncbi:MAG: hypothetical protein ABEN55_17490, partial [Bradymonadaceae bacterium]